MEFELDDYLTPYYFINGVLAFSYIGFRLLGYYSARLLLRDDWLGHTREASILGMFTLIAFARYKKFCTLQHLVASFLFYLKIANLALFYFMDIRIMVAYGMICACNLRFLIV